MRKTCIFLFSVNPLKQRRYALSFYNLNKPGYNVNTPYSMSHIVSSTYTLLYSVYTDTAETDYDIKHFISH